MERSIKIMKIFMEYKKLTSAKSNQIYDRILSVNMETSNLTSQKLPLMLPRFLQPKNLQAKFNFYKQKMSISIKLRIRIPLEELCNQLTNN
jgi:hypothetical protein